MPPGSEIDQALVDLLCPHTAAVGKDGREVYRRLLGLDGFTAGRRFGRIGDGNYSLMKGIVRCREPRSLQWAGFTLGYSAGMRAFSEGCSKGNWQLFIRRKSLKKRT